MVAMSSTVLHHVWCYGVRSYGVAHTTWYGVVLVMSSCGVRSYGICISVADGVTHDAAPL